MEWKRMEYDINKPREMVCWVSGFTSELVYDKGTSVTSQNNLKIGHQPRTRADARRQGTISFFGRTDLMSLYFYRDILRIFKDTVWRRP